MARARSLHRAALAVACALGCTAAARGAAPAAEGGRIERFSGHVRAGAGFVAIATPPYRGVNPRMIEAWHFRNAANTGPNRGDVNAPQEERTFRFVADARDHAAVAAAVDLALWPNGRAQSAVDSAITVIDSLSRGAGMLRIHDLRLAGFGRGVTPVITSMSFDVTLTPPPEPAR